MFHVCPKFDSTSNLLIKSGSHINGLHTEKCSILVVFRVSVIESTVLFPPTNRIGNLAEEVNSLA